MVVFFFSLSLNLRATSDESARVSQMGQTDTESEEKEG